MRVLRIAPGVRNSLGVLTPCANVFTWRVVLPIGALCSVFILVFALEWFWIYTLAQNESARTYVRIQSHTHNQ